MNEDLTLGMNTRPSDPRFQVPSDIPAAREAWGRFKLLARVGQGGFGEVYRAWDPDLEREVALKLLLPSSAGTGQSDEEYQAMLREARALASVRHANIVPVYGIDRHDGRVGFWTDFVKGRTLTSLLGSQGPFGYREAAMIALDVTRALSAVHRAGILHRDIKADNVMREEGGRILLMDFGLSTLPHRQSDIAGTPNYMAPELWQGFAASVESDIYAMGVLLFYLVTDEYPAKLGGLSVAEVVAALAKRRTLMDVRSDLPESYLRMVSRATETDPAKRYASAGQLAEALAECLGTSVPVETAVAPVAVPVAETKREKRPWQLRVAIAVFLLGAAAFKTPTVRGWLHLGKTAETANNAGTASPDSSEEYTRAQALLSKSYKDSNVAEAVKIFASIPKDDPTYSLAQAGLGAAYFKQYKNSGDPTLLDKAKAATRVALDQDDKLAPARVTMAQIDANAGNNDLALSEVKSVIADDPRSAEAYAAEGVVYESQGNLKDAVTAVKNAIDIDDGNSMWWLLLGNYYKSSGDIALAATTWQTATKKDPENLFAWYDLGIANKQLDKLPEAREDFLTALKLDPNDEYSLRALGTVYQLEGNYTEAEKMDQQAIKLDANDYEAWTNLGNVYAWSGGKRDQAMGAYNKAITISEARLKDSPKSVDLVIGLANLYASVGNADKSLPLARRALALAPENPGVQYLAGYSYELLGQRGNAISWIAKSIAQGGPANEVRQSPELASLRSDPAFSAALTKARADAAVDRGKKLN